LRGRFSPEEGKIWKKKKAFRKNLVAFGEGRGVRGLWKGGRVTVESDRGRERSQRTLEGGWRRTGGEVRSIHRGKSQ